MKIQIGDNIVEVDDKFAGLQPEEQQKIVAGITTQLQYQKAASVTQTSAAQKAKEDEPGPAGAFLHKAADAVIATGKSAVDLLTPHSIPGALTEAAIGGGLWKMYQGVTNPQIGTAGNPVGSTPGAQKIPVTSGAPAVEPGPVAPTAPTAPVGEPLPKPWMDALRQPAPGATPAPAATPPIGGAPAAQAESFISKLAQKYAPLATRVGTGVGAMLYSPNLNEGEDKDLIEIARRRAELRRQLGN